MFRARLIILAVAGLTGCASIETTPPEGTDDLLSGQLLFGEHIDTSGIDPGEVLEINDDMRRYVAKTVRGHPQGEVRLKRLLKGMIDDGLLTMEYDPNQTHTAIETFARHEGNCLSFSILFTALAREAGLRTRFQMVDVPPSFRSDGDVIMLDNHINVKIQGMRGNKFYRRDFVVDFNDAGYQGRDRGFRVDDNYAIALYFSNVAVEYVRKGDWRTAFRYLKKAIETDPEIPGLWVNLGVAYSQNDQPELAVDAYQQALAIHPSYRSALVNMTAALNKLGRYEEAEYYSKRARYYRNRHPYYHYHLAETAYEEDRLDDSLAHLKRAIRLKDDEHQFYYLRGLVHQQQNELDLAADDFSKAREVAEDPRLESGYSKKIDELRSSLN